MNSIKDIESSLIESYDENYIDIWSFPKRGYKLLSEKKLFPAQSLSENHINKLKSIKCPDPEFIPAAVILKDGSYLPRVVFIDEMTVLSRHVNFWTNFIRPNNLSDVIPSPFQIPFYIAQKLWQTPETSMGSLEFEVYMQDGTIIPCWYSMASDFIILPSPYRPKDIIDVRLGRGIAASQNRDNVLGQPNQIWCVYKSGKFALPP
jgi:hypothetical protein